MKRFQFKLENLLRLREHELARARSQFRRVDTERRARDARVSELGERLRQGCAQLDEQVRMGEASRRLALRAQGIASGRFELGRAEAAVEEIMASWNEAQLAVRQARTRLRSLEKLRDKAWTEYRFEAERAQQMELDESAVVRAARVVSAGAGVR